MTNCCTQIESYQENICPVNGKKGKKVSLSTLKSLLKPMALTKLNPEKNYYFCDSEDCQVVYFSQEKQVYTLNEIKY